MLGDAGIPTLALWAQVPHYLAGGASPPAIRALLARLGELGVERIVLSDRDDALALGPVGIRLPRGVPDWLMPIVSIVPGQLLARHLAIARGLDPEAPRWIGKVTLTR